MQLRWNLNQGTEAKFNNIFDVYEEKMGPKNRSLGNTRDEMF